MGSTTLSEADQHHLARFERRRDILRDRTRAVAERYQTGCYLVGRPGVGKSHTVAETLEVISKPYVAKNCRMSAAGLFEVLASHPEHTVVLDDINTLFKQQGALQIIMGALGGEPGRPREITYTIKGNPDRAWFCGGVVAISNVPLKRDPLADAVASRVTPYEFSPSDEEVIAYIRYLASQGYEDLTPSECSEVAEFVIRESRDLDYRLDLRTLVKGWQDYRLHKHGRALTPWRDLILSSMRPVAIDRPRSRSEAIDSERRLAQELFDKYRTDKDLRDGEWHRLTGKSIDTLYRRMREVKAGF